ncbi:MAG TPA: EAL domain-containing protein, partial [Burkholderiales bacterium]|nr:EAL domain-containing protein [Burkholderiales bacterium]
GGWDGEIWNRRKNGEIYPKWLSIHLVKDRDGRITNFIALFSDITERKASFEQIEHLAHYDALTNLPNRSLLNERLDSAIAAAKRNGSRVAVLFLDLDRFKHINDSLGHFAGDLLLQAVANRLKRCIREIDTVARIGGDEFVMVLNGIRESADAAHVAQKVLETMTEPVFIEGREIVTTPSIGISLYPDDGQNHAALIRNSDAAMYHAKDLGRGNFQFFTDNMNARAFEALSFESYLKLALKREEFSLHYQPQIDIRSGRIVGMEALIRWLHPERGYVSPSNFIPVAEECGAIGAIGEWVLKTACSQNRIWQQSGLPVVPVAVNLSAVQFRQKDIAEKLRDILEETGLPPSLLELEMTERIIMQDADSTIGTLFAIKGMGLMLSIDDFGTGYSSLSYLKRFPIDKLKIDRSFVCDIATDPDDAAIISTIITMGHHLRLKVIAEGVETEEQLAFLKQEGCDEAQGYLFSSPVPAAEFESLLRKQAAI